MTTLNPNSHPWRAEREIIDWLALLSDIDDRRQVIREHGLYGTDFDQVFREAVDMGVPLRALRKELQANYCKIVSLIEKLEAG